MKPLETGRQAFTWLYTDASDVALRTGQIVARNLFKYSFIILFLFGLIAVATFSLSFSWNNLEESAYNLYQINIVFISINGINAIFSCSAKIASVFSSLSNIYEKCKSCRTFHKNKYNNIN